MKRIILLTLAVLVFTVLIANAGGPVVKVKVPPPPPPPIYVPLPPPPPPMPLFFVPRMKPTFGLTVYMTDYKAILRETGFAPFNFGEAFGWGTKEAVTEWSLGVTIPTIADASFTWIAPVTRTGSGIPLVPITVGGYTFGPRLADTISMKTTLSGERFTFSTPWPFATRKAMPTGMLEWWHMQANVNGTPNVTTTSQAPVDVRQNFNKLIFGMGLSGEVVQRPLMINYKALYTVGAQTAGWLVEGGLGYKQDNMSARVGYRYSVRTANFNEGANNLHIDTNGPFVEVLLFPRL